jgi:hypothetical protein
MSRKSEGRCQACGEVIRWALTPGGAWVPLEAAEMPDTELTDSHGFVWRIDETAVLRRGRVAQVIPPGPIHGIHFNSCRYGRPKSGDVDLAEDELAAFYGGPLFLEREERK